MTQNVQNSGAMIRKRLTDYCKVDDEYWSFRSNAVREHMHAYFRYPAMMVPQMQEILIKTVVEVLPKTKSLYEPFVGSGTVMTEAMKVGLDFVGCDINPLAVLLCHAKSGPFYVEAITDRLNDLFDRINRDRKTRIEADFYGLSKWFRYDVAVELSRIRRAIRSEKYLWCRRFYWVSLAEVVRLTSNSRITTYKLYARSNKETRLRELSPITIFSDMIKKNLTRLLAKKALLQENNLLQNGRYKGHVEVRLNDSTTPIYSTNRSQLHDLLITSPPYGDNRTTIAYGQYSYLPLQWIDLEDIDTNLDASLLSSTQEIDRRSLGGHVARSLKETSCLLDISNSYKRTIRILRYEPEDRALRVTSFCRDLYRCIVHTLKVLRSGAYMIWTIGNRSVAGHVVPMDKILSELLIANKCELVMSIRRGVPVKRLVATKNSVSTINKETILILRKAAA